MYGGPKIQHLEDVPIEEMLRFEFEDGHTASIWERWIEMSPRYVAFWNRWDPGAMTASHGHTGDHIVFILKGEIRCGDVVCTAGSHIMLEWGDVFGPWEAGSDGCELYGFIAGEGSPFAGDSEAFEKLLAERGARMVPLPMPTRLPPWAKLQYASGDKGSVTNWSSPDRDVEETR
jgi:hypothetical protein